jgi:hypothetical protein
MLVYHGGTSEIHKPLVTVGREGLDFGKGFYLTDLEQQAVLWAGRLADRRGKKPILNTYDLDIDRVKSDYRYKLFPKYDIEWLDFIAANRKGLGAWKQFDIIEGGIADDRVVDTVESYIAGLMSAEMALQRLSHYKPNNQICITNQTLADDFLVFKESVILNNE